VSFKDTMGECVEKLAQIDADLRSTVEQQEGGWKHQYLRLRQDFQKHLYAMATLEQQWPVDITANAQQYREIYNKLRAATALHYTKFPVVLIDPANPAFIESAKGVREEIAHLVDFGRRLVR